MRAPLEQKAERALREVDRCDAREEAVAAYYAGETVTLLGGYSTPSGSDAPPPSEDEEPSRAERLSAALVPFSDEELDASREPHPHVFREYERALFPIGEVTVLGARGREGKTTVMLAVATAIAIEHSLAGLWPMKGRSVVIFSAEDDREQFARKVAAQRALVSPEQAEQLKRRVIVPDLTQPGMEPLRRLVTTIERQPISTGTDAAIIEAITPMMQGDHPPALLIFETAATFTDTDEDNRAYAVLIDCLRGISRALGVAVSLSHHTNQASDTTLADLSISTASIRGGTTLIYNSRQNLLLVNLGSESDPFPDNDARTVLREMVAPDRKERVTVLVAMETSKANDPAPIFFRWERTDYDPAAVELDAPDALAGKSWRKVREMVMAERGTRRAEAKASAQSAGVETVVQVVRKLHASGKQPTARAVSVAAGKSPTWAKPYLDAALDDRLITCQPEKVPHTKGMTTVYRAIDSTEGKSCTVE